VGIGTRTIAAICIAHEDSRPLYDDPSWFNGPPYTVAEGVFDEYDFGGCRTMDDLEQLHSTMAQYNYKALTPGAKPRYDTMLKLLHALGVKLSASPVHS
jgi:hypothetical protein